MSKSYSTTWQMPGTSRAAETLKIESSIFDRYNFTIGFWFKPTNSQVITDRYVCLFDIYVDSSNYWRIIIGPDGIPYGEIKSGGTTYTNTSDQVFETDLWYYIAMYGNSEQYAFSVNGIEAGTIDYTMPVGTLPDYLWLGSNSSSTSQANGVYSDLVVLPYRTNNSQINGYIETQRPYYNLPRFEVTGDLVNRNNYNPMICDGQITSINVTEGSLRQYYKVGINMLECPTLLSVLTQTQEEVIEETPNAFYSCGIYCNGSPVTSGIDANKIDDLFYAFADVSGTSVTIATPSHLTSLVALKATNPALNPVLSVGGWAQDFSTAMGSASNRTTFANNLWTLMQTYSITSVDIDCEYPTTAQKTEFTLLIEAIRNKIGSNNFLSIAVPGSDFHTKFDYLELGHLVDSVNLMTYDLYQNGTQHAASLYSGTLAPVYCCKNAVDVHVSYGIPASKLYLGVPFYGYTTTTTKTYDQLVSSYINLNGYIRQWDNTCKVPYLTSGGSMVISYDDSYSIAEKCAYAKAQGLRGVFAWQARQNTSRVLLNAMWNGLK